jgi:hypothetical protein
LSAPCGTRAGCWVQVSPRTVRSLTDGSSWASPFPCPPAGQTPLSSVQAFPTRVGTMPSADFCPALERLTAFPVTQDDSGRSPEVSSTAFGAQPPDLPPVRLMDMSFAIMCPLAPHRRPRHPVLVHRLAPLLHASFRPRLATTPLRFAITSPPSGCEEDFHLQAVDHARHTQESPARQCRVGGSGTNRVPQGTAPGL